MEFPNGQNVAGSQARRGESRSAIIDAAERLFLQRGFGSVSMDELAEAAGVARRTLYNQFSSKEEIFREMLLRVSGQLERAFPPGLETEGDGEHVLNLIAQMILRLHENPVYLGFLRMVVADARQFPWIAEEFAAVMEPQTERLTRYLAHLTDIGMLDCRNHCCAHQFGDVQRAVSMALMTGRESACADEDIIEETVRMFLQHRRAPTKNRGRAAGARRRTFWHPCMRRKPERRLSKNQGPLWLAADAIDAGKAGVGRSRPARPGLMTAVLATGVAQGHRGDLRGSGGPRRFHSGPANGLEAPRALQSGDRPLTGNSSGTDRTMIFDRLSKSLATSGRLKDKTILATGARRRHIASPAWPVGVTDSVRHQGETGGGSHDQIRVGKTAGRQRPV
jgi:AcrR family transcriptional regulator